MSSNTAALDRESVLEAAEDEPDMSTDEARRRKTIRSIGPFLCLLWSSLEMRGV